MPRRAVLFSGGYAHPFHETSPALAQIAEAGGWDCRIETELDRAIETLAETELLLVNALKWSMTQHEKYAPARAEYAYSLPPSAMTALEGFVAGGGRLFALHTATICFDTEPGWRRLLGGGWQWGVSHHPPRGRFQVEPTAAGRSLCPGLEAFAIVDELYHRLDPVPKAQILIEAEIAEGKQPLAWVREFGRGRVAVDALGHDAASLATPGHRAAIAGQLAWLAGDLT